MATKASVQRMARSLSLSRNPNFRRDLTAFLSAPLEELRSFASELMSMRGFATRDSVRRVAEGAIKDSDTAGGVARFTTGIDDIFRRFGEPADVFREVLVSSLENEKAIESTQREDLEQRIQLVISLDSALGRAYKARELATATGSPLDEFKIVCDLRPIFDDTRRNVLGMVLLTTLKIEWSTREGLTQTVELILNESHIDSIAEEIAHAQSKRHALQALAEKFELSVPGEE